MNKTKSRLFADIFKGHCGIFTHVFLVMKPFIYRNDNSQYPTWLQDSPYLSQAQEVIINMLENVGGSYNINKIIGEWN